MYLLHAMLKRFIQTGTLRLIDADNTKTLYRGSGRQVDVTVRLTDPTLYRSLLLNPEMRAAEAYVDGTLVIEQGTIHDLLTLFALNRANLRNQPLQKALRGAYKKLRFLVKRNKKSKARANVAHHYDISNELYKLFLDEDMHYSCAYFRSENDTLEEAQRNKIRHIAAKLDVKPGQKILDIGSGWGGMACYLAEMFDVEVLGVTLSTDQQQLATERAKQRGLADKVRFELTDYRDVQGSFDRIVSIGMFEHVGISQQPEFFAKVKSLLTDDGVALLHSIGRMGGPGATSPWIRKYIFPGCHVPALSETLASIEKQKLWVTDMEILRVHYANTLREWNARFQSKRGEVATMFDERFCRMWEFYLAATEVGFRYGKQMVFQVQLTKNINALPLTRDYIAEMETDLIAREKKAPKKAAA